MIELINHKDGLFTILKSEGEDAESPARLIDLSAGELLDLELEIWRALDKQMGERPSLHLRMKRLRTARGLTE